MNADESQLTNDVRRGLEAIGDAAAPARQFDEIGVPPPGTDSDRSTRPQRVLAVAGSLAVLCALVAGLLVVRSNRDDTSPTGVPENTTGAATTVAPAEPVPTVAPPSSAPPAEPVPTAIPTSVAPSTSALPDNEQVLREVRRAQFEALRKLPGFTATAVKTVFTPSTGEPESEQTAQVTLLADGSFFADQGERGWGSFDPATHLVRGVFQLPDGTTGYQEIVGQAQNTVPLNILTGHDPTALVQYGGPADTTVRESTFEGRSVWEVTTVFGFDRSMCEGECAGPPSTQTTVQTIDQETGLVIRNSITSTAPNTVPNLSVLRDVQIVDSMPPGFPGSFPEGVTVDRSGDPNAVATIALGDIATRFGIAVPLPAGFEDSTISYQEMDGMWTGDGGTEATTFHRTVEFSVPEGFTTTRVRVSAISVPPGGVVPPGMIVVDGGFVCSAAPGADQCESLDATTVSSQQMDGAVTLTSGALAGLGAYQSDESASITSGPFQISILAGDRAAALAIANDFVLVEP